MLEQRLCRPQRWTRGTRAHELDIKQLSPFKDQKGERRGSDIAFSIPLFHMNFMKHSNGFGMISGKPVLVLGTTPRRIMNVVRLLRALKGGEK